MDYKAGVAIYKTLPSAKNRTVSVLERGRSDRNMATLIGELRKAKNARPVPEVKVKPAAPLKTIPAKPEPPQKEAQQNFLKDEASKKYFSKIRYAELPAELKVRFRKAKDLFYDMCDLKFQLNDLPDEAEKEALTIMLQIEDLDEQKDTIWKELEHWQLYKTMLPVKASEDFSALTDLQKEKKRGLLANYIKKKTARITKWQQAAEAETDKAAQRKILQQINRTEKSLHQDEINLRKIEELL
mgnify:CR=1 FL=1